MPRVSSATSRCSRSGRRSGGKPLARGALYRLLGNRLYRGKIVHRGKCHPGQHEAIVDADLWERVQALLDANRVERANGSTARHPSLLVGLLFDEHGEHMTPTHAVKNGRRYRYYISRPLTTVPRETTPEGRRMPAGDVEDLVVNRLRAALSDEATVLETIGSHAVEATEQKRLLQCARTLSRGWDELTEPRLRALLRALIARIDVQPKRVDIHLVASRVAEVLLGDPHALPPASELPEKTNRLTLSVTAELKRAGMGTKLVIDARDAGRQKARPDASLVKLIIRAHDLNRKLIESGGASLAAIARREGLTGSYMTRLVRLSHLSPDITRSILDGRQPVDLTAARLTRLSKLPLDWDQQKAIPGACLRRRPSSSH
jgi:site-specific DNA recombinase